MVFWPRVLTRTRFTLQPEVTEEMDTVCEIMVFKTMSIKQLRIINPERWETNEVSQDYPNLLPGEFTGHGRELAPRQCSLLPLG